MPKTMTSWRRGPTRRRPRGGECESAAAAAVETPAGGVASVVNDDVGGTPVVLALASDDASFFAYRRADTTRYALRRDSLV